MRLVHCVIFYLRISLLLVQRRWLLTWLQAALCHKTDQLVGHLRKDSLCELVHLCPPLCILELVQLNKLADITALYLAITIDQ